MDNDTGASPQEKPDDLATGRRVLENEAQALESLSASLGPSFTTAVEALSAAEGRVGERPAPRHHGDGGARQSGSSPAELAPHPGGDDHRQPGGQKSHDLVLALMSAAHCFW